MDRRVSSIGAADAPRAADVIRPGVEAVVAALAKGRADGMDRREVEHVEAHPADGVEAIGQIGERAVVARHAAPRPGKHLVPAAKPGAGPVDPDRTRLIEPGLVAPV